MSEVQSSSYRLNKHLYSSLLEGTYAEEEWEDADGVERHYEIYSPDDAYSLIYDCIY